jgi:tetratricopeptide (TPR) repeat protein
MFRSSSIWVAFLAALFWVYASGGPAHAQEGSAAQATAALTEASKYLDEGIPVKAIDAINRVLKSGKISSDLAARALLLRARAQEKIGKYAYALADYNQALWMQGLSSSDKGEAEAGRARIMAKLGVDDDSAKTAAAPQQPDKPKRTASNARDAADRGANVQTSPSEERTGGIFGGLFGSSETSPSQQTAEPAPPPKPAPRAAAQPVNVAASTRTANVSDDSTANDAGAPAREPTGDFAIQFAALHSEDSAIYEVERIGKRYSEWLGGRTPSITIRPTAEGGTLYKIIAEPYERGEGVATCELLKTKGVSCMLISR